MSIFNKIYNLYNIYIICIYIYQEYIQAQGSNAQWVCLLFFLCVFIQKFVDLSRKYDCPFQNCDYFGPNSELFVHTHGNAQEHMGTYPHGVRYVIRASGRGL